MAFVAISSYLAASFKTGYLHYYSIQTNLTRYSVISRRIGLFTIALICFFTVNYFTLKLIAPTSSHTLIVAILNTFSASYAFTYLILLKKQNSSEVRKKLQNIKKVDDQIRKRDKHTPQW